MTCSRCNNSDPNCYVCQNKPAQYDGTREMIKGYSDSALRGAIDQLSASRMWPSRLFELRAELDRRKRQLRRNPSK